MSRATLATGNEQMSVQTDERVMHLSITGAECFASAPKHASGEDEVTAADILQCLDAVARHARRTTEVLRRGLGDSGGKS